MFMSASQLGQCTALFYVGAGVRGVEGCCFLPNTSTVIKGMGEVRLTNSLREGNMRSCKLACEMKTMGRERDATTVRTTNLLLKA
jgi:hypothetical protein